MMLMGAVSLALVLPGDLGLIAWFGLHPILIIVAALIAGAQFKTLVHFVRMAPLLVVLLLTLSALAACRT